jgi:integrase
MYGNRHSPSVPWGTERLKSVGRLHLSRSPPDRPESDPGLPSAIVAKASTRRAHAREAAASHRSAVAPPRTGDSDVAGLPLCLPVRPHSAQRSLPFWCGTSRYAARQRACELPAAPEAVALYLTARAETCKTSTLQRRLSSISQAHQAANLESPTQNAAVSAVWAGIRRAKGTAQQGKAPCVTADLRQMIEALPDNLLGVRDRALLLIGFAGAFRRSELVSLNREDVEVTNEGLVITLRRGKCDQEAAGRKVGVPFGSNPATCPVRSLKAWLEASEITTGPLFRSVNRHGQLQPVRLSPKAVALTVKKRAAEAGLDAAKFSGHSLRSGLATSAAASGASERAIMAQTGHRSLATVRKYIRPASLFLENAASSLGL